MIQRLQCTLGFTDESRPTRRAKPAGVIGAEMIRAATVRERSSRTDAPPSADPSELTLLALDTRAPYTLDFAGVDGGKNASYLLRWVNPTGEKGPWSETATATIGV
jgi:hypothetical protein